MPTPYALSSDLVSAWPAKSLEIATYLDTSLAAKYDNAPAINAQVGTTYTFVLADATAGKTITASNASASTYTVPPQSSVAFSAGALLRVTNLGAGVVTFAGGVGVTVTNTAGTLSQYQTATLVRTGSDAWTVIKMGGSTPGMTLSNTSAMSGSSVSVNNVFTSAARSYMLVFDFTCSSTSADLYLRMRVGGVDASGTNYQRQQIYSFNTNTVAGANSTVTAHQLAGSGSFNYSGQLLVMGPQLAQETKMLGTTHNDGNALLISGCRHTLATSYDGFSIYVGAGTFSAGSISTYAMA